MRSRRRGRPSVRTRNRSLSRVRSPVVVVLRARGDPRDARHRPRRLPPRRHTVSMREAGTWTVVWITLAMLFGRIVAAQAAASRPARSSPATSSRSRLPSTTSSSSRWSSRPSACPRHTSTGCSSTASWARSSMRGAFIGVGAALIDRFHWIIYVFGGIPRLHRDADASGRASRARPDGAIRSCDSSRVSSR